MLRLLHTSHNQCCQFQNVYDMMVSRPKKRLQLLLHHTVVFGWRHHYYEWRQQQYSVVVVGVIVLVVVGLILLCRDQAQYVDWELWKGLFFSTLKPMERPTQHGRGRRHRHQWERPSSSLRRQTQCVEQRAPLHHTCTLNEWNARAGAAPHDTKVCCWGHRHTSSRVDLTHHFLKLSQVDTTLRFKLVSLKPAECHGVRRGHGHHQELWGCGSEEEAAQCIFPFECSVIE